MTTATKINHQTYHPSINQNESSLRTGDQQAVTKHSARSRTLKNSTFSVTFRGTDRAESSVTGGGGGLQYSHWRKAAKRLC